MARHRGRGRPKKIKVESPDNEAVIDEQKNTPSDDDEPATANEDASSVADTKEEEDVDGAVNGSKHECSVCKRVFKSSLGLKYHTGPSMYLPFMFVFIH
jgi:hypothetical protein